MTAWSPSSTLAKAVVAAGFWYDPSQDIIQSVLWPLQRRLGYTYAYDAGAAPVHMIIDCEPFYFSYDGKCWLIELWKGQYGLETGAEIGVYRDDVVPASVSVSPGVRFYSCMNQEVELCMRFRLYRNGSLFIHRGPETHFWLTGFRWGVFTTKTQDLTMELEITFPPKKPEMRDAFKEAVRARGYNATVQGMTVAFTFISPRSQQPGSRAQLERIVQADNEKLVGAYNLLKAELNLLSNDPNGFGKLDEISHNVVQAAVSEAASKIRHNASAVASKIHTGVAKKVIASPPHKQISRTIAGGIKKHPGQLPGELIAAYRQISEFFDNQAWHSTLHPKQAATA